MAEPEHSHFLAQRRVFQLEGAIIPKAAWYGLRIRRTIKTEIAFRLGNLGLNEGPLESPSARHPGRAIGEETHGRRTSHKDHRFILQGV